MPQNTMEMLLVAAAAASWLLLISAPLASEAAFPFRLPRVGSYARPSYTTPASSRQQFGKMFNKYAPDIIQNLPPPPTPDEGRSSPGAPPGAPTPDESGRGLTPAVYIVGFQVGTPPQIITGILDISSQLVWMQCAPCTACLPPASNIFQPGNSKTYESVTCDNDPSCGYNVTYSDTTSTAGHLFNDTFTIFDVTPPEEGMVLGCSESTTGDYSGASGVIGFGRGPLSVVSQLSLSNFSYFLGPSGGVVQLDGVVAAVPRTAGRSRSTPLLNGTVYTDPYYVNLTGILVDGNELVDIPPGTFDLRNDSSGGGVYLSTAEPFTYLVSEAYTAVRKAFASSIPQQPTSLDDLDPLCYTVQSMDSGVNNVPRLTLVFDGEDATMELSKENYFSKFKDGESEGDMMECLTVLPSTGASLLGSLLQTGTTMIYDLVGQQLTFEYDVSPSPAPARLASESPAPASPSLATIVALAVWMMLS